MVGGIAARGRSVRLTIILLLIALAGCSAPNDANPPSNGNASTVMPSSGINAPAQRAKPTLVLVSIDGFRWDYPELFDLPAIRRLAASGVRAEAMVPVFPTLTFPNHYSIATGLYPANHGIVANTFPTRDRQSWYNYRRRETVQDGSWYGGEPVWVAAERNGMVSAAFFFVGTEADVDGIRPSHWRPFDYDVSGSDRVDQVLEWLAMPAESRPHVVTLYFEHVDVASHTFGPESEENHSAARQVDEYIDRLVNGVAGLPAGGDVYFLLVSDHGQSTYEDGAQPFVLADHAELDGISSVDGGSMSFLYFEQPDAERAARIRDTINENWDHGKAWLRHEAPADFHVTDASLFPDLIVLADPHHAVISKRNPNYELLQGNHGWSPAFADMHGVFIASGPRLPMGHRIDRISAVDVYPLMLEILGLPQRGPIDGDPGRLVKLLE